MNEFFLMWLIHAMDNFSYKKEWGSDTGYNMDKSWKRYVTERSQVEGHLFYDSIHMK